MTLVHSRKDLPLQGGVCTPASALGKRLFDRVSKHPYLDFKIE
jgi:short subunit dehydrogenase-like uncharacterized protein